MSQAEEDQKGRAGVHAVGLIVSERLSWIFREQPTSDFGIDAHVEIVATKGPTGRLLALQIKNGSSFFSERTESGFVFRGSQRHLDYWTHHALPVVLVLRDPSNGACYWQSVTKETITSTGEGWKLVIPFSQVLGTDSKDALERLCAPSDYEVRRTALALAKPWMELISEDRRLILIAEEWVNKSSGRGSLQLALVEDGDDQGEIVHDWPFVMFPGKTYDEVFQALFPWASINVDEDYYYDEELSHFQQGYGTYDREDDVWHYDPDEFREWRAELAQIRPHSLSHGEVAHYRLELTLNEVGRAFLKLDAFLNSGEVAAPRAGHDPTGAQSGLKALTKRYLGGGSE